MEEKDYIHSNSTLSSPCCTCNCCNDSKAAVCHCISSLSLLVSHILHSHSLTLLSSDASIIGINGKLLHHIFNMDGTRKPYNMASIMPQFMLPFCTKWVISCPTCTKLGWGICNNNGNILTITPFAICVGNCPFASSA